MRYIKSIALNIFNIALKLKERMKLCRFALYLGDRKGVCGSRERRPRVVCPNAEE